jgi:hypothetical protein
LTAFVLGVGCSAAHAQDAQKERHLSLKGKFDNQEGWQFVGPDAEECVRFEPEGMRIVLPLGHVGERANTGMKVTTPGKGDFEISVNFEILKEPKVADAGMRAATLKVIAHLSNPQSRVGISRRVTVDEGAQFTTWLNLPNPEAKKPKIFLRAFATESKKGRLRMVRTGAVVTYSIAKDGDAEFTRLHQFPAIDEDLQAVSLVGQTGGPQAAFDVRLTDLRVRVAADVDVEPPLIVIPEKAKQNLLMVGILAFLALALILVAIAAWLYVRRKSLDRPAPPVVTGTKQEAP